MRSDVIENKTRGLKRFEVGSPSLLGEEVAQTFLNEISSEKQTICKTKGPRVVCAAQTKEVRKLFSGKNKQPLRPWGMVGQGFGAWVDRWSSSPPAGQ
ncbi:hypothetical protein Hanom_Chr14g01263621 [Helianthus anomalus]